MNGKPALACANNHHNEKWWEYLTYRGYQAVRCKLCKKFIGYVRTQSSEKRRGLQTQDGEELTERDYV